MNVPFPGGWRYGVAAMGGWLLFLALLVAAQAGRGLGWPDWGVTLLALGPAVIVALQFYVAYRLVARQDEFVRALFAKGMLVAAALVVVVATAWSGAELLGAPHLPAWLLYPLLWGFFGLATPLLRGSAA